MEKTFLKDWNWAIVIGTSVEILRIFQNSVYMVIPLRLFPVPLPLNLPMEEIFTSKNLMILIICIFHQKREIVR